MTRSPSKHGLPATDLKALRSAAERAWGDDTRHPAYEGHPQASMGQCYVTAAWLVHRLGGSIGTRQGHYFWVSPDRRHILDLTGEQYAYRPEDPALEGLKLDEDDSGLHLEPYQTTYRPGPIMHKSADHPLYAGFSLVEPSDHDRADKFIARANHYFDNPTIREALDYGGDALPMEEPQAVEDLAQRYWHDEPNHAPQSGEYQFVYANGQLHVSSIDDHESLAQQSGADLDHGGPMAAGHVTLNSGHATWSVTGNISAQALSRIFKEYTKHVGWDWGGMTDIDEMPISEEFAPKQSKIYKATFEDGHLVLGLNTRVGWEDIHGDLRGYIKVDGEDAYVSLPKISQTEFDALEEWANDFGLTLLGRNDNVLRTIEDLQQYNIYTPTPTEPDNHQYFPPGEHEREPSGAYRCNHCGKLCPNWPNYRSHLSEHEKGDDPEQDSGFPEVNMDATFPTHFTEQQPFVMGTTKEEAQRVDGYRLYAKLWSLDDDDNEHFVAYRYGSPVGYAVVSDNKLLMIQSAIRNQGVGSTLMAYLMRHYPELESDSVSEEGARLMKRAGWFNTSGQTYKWAQGKEPKDLLEESVPFIYDIQEDGIYVGPPGTRHSDIQGRFTPGGIVEGMYEPGGKVIIRTMTNMPYSTRHMLELWYAQHPEYKIVSVHLRDDAGKDTRLAAQDIGGYITALVGSDPTTHTAAKALMDAGGDVYVVGGAVRDALLDKEPNDLDLMVTGLPPDQVQKILSALPGRVDYTGKDFGVFRYRNKGDDVEVALPRRERSSGVGYKDFDVHADHTMRPEEDLYRRDFTPNSMAVDLKSGRLLDPFGGHEDIQNGEFRSLNDTSLSEDPLRVVRALTLHSKHGLEPTSETRAQMKVNAESLQHLPPERIQTELDKIMRSPNPARAIKLAHETGVLKHILPEVEAAYGYDQNNPHHELELGEHLTNVLDRVAGTSDDPDLRLAALLHDIGKPASAWVDPEHGTHHYYRDEKTGQGQDHELVGADMARRRMSELRYPSDRIQRVNDLIRNHMWPAFTHSKGARRFLHRVGDHADDLLKLRWADQGGKSEYPTDPSLSLNTQRQLIDRVRNEGQATNRTQLAINGHDIMGIGITPGPIMGQILSELTDEVLDNPELNNKDYLLTRARQIATIST